MKGFFKKAFDIHSSIGKVFTCLCVFCFISAVLGIFLGTTRVVHRDTVAETNVFLGEESLIHDSNYSLVVERARNADSVTILNKKGEEVTYNGYFIVVNALVSQKEDSTLKQHVIDRDDFKLKDHTGVYVPMSDIMGAIGWDAIDMHFDDTGNGTVMSSTEFSTTKSFVDYSYIGKAIQPGVTLSLELKFKMSKFIDVTKELVAMEIDFFVSSKGYRIGSDIILLCRPENLKNKAF